MTYKDDLVSQSVYKLFIVGDNVQVVGFKHALQKFLELILM